MVFMVEAACLSTFMTIPTSRIIAAMISVKINNAQIVGSQLVGKIPPTYPPDLQPSLNISSSIDQRPRILRRSFNALPKKPTIAFVSWLGLLENTLSASTASSPSREKLLNASTISMDQVIISELFLYFSVFQRYFVFSFPLALA